MRYLLSVLAALFLFAIVSHATASSSKPPVKKRLVLITGCARSGTTYISEVLQACGLDVKHETDGADGIASWMMAVPASKTPSGPFLIDCNGPGLNEYKFKHIFHQVRHPLKTIASASNECPKSWEFIHYYFPQIKPDEPDTVKAAKYWYYWNLRAEKIAEFTYRVEDVDTVWDELARRLGCALDKSVLEKIPRTVNKRWYTNTLTWAELEKAITPALYKKIVMMAKRYGYSVADELLHAE